MKKILVSFVLLLCISYSALADNDRPVSVDALPREIKDFVSTHFEGKTISYATREWNSHEIYLEGGIKIEFEGYQWDEIGGYNLPDNILKLLPEKSVEYLRQTFANVGVCEIHKERYGYEIKLANGVEVMFFKDGAFIGYDD